MLIHNYPRDLLLNPHFSPPTSRYPVKTMVSCLKKKPSIQKQNTYSAKQRYPSTIPNVFFPPLVAINHRNLPCFKLQISRMARSPRDSGRLRFWSSTSCPAMEPLSRWWVPPWWFTKWGPQTIAFSW